VLAPETSKCDTISTFSDGVSGATPKTPLYKSDFRANWLVRIGSETVGLSKNL
jgi:hypothetical protein